MKIIDKHTDYYDHYSYIYGVDEKVTLDRRSSIKLDNDVMFSLIPKLYSYKYKDYEYLSENFSFYLLLEVGYKQYLLEVFNLSFSHFPTTLTDYDIKVVHTFEENKNQYGGPLSIRNVEVNKYWKRGQGYVFILEGEFNTVVKAPKKSEVIVFPILAESKITSIIDGEDIWKELQNYISSLNNEKKVDLNLSDEEKAVNHGFDKKTSFRNIK